MLSEITLWIMTWVKNHEILIYIIINKLINQLQHTYNDSELKKWVIHNFKAFKQKNKSFIKYLIIFKHILMKAEDLEWYDTVKKIYFDNNLNVTFIRVLITILISSLYNDYVVLLQWVNHNLKFIIKFNTSEQCTIITIIIQQLHSNSINWELTNYIYLIMTDIDEKHWA